jgi:hypothetical protein
MIKLKYILNEILENNTIQSIVNNVYPQIVKDLGGQITPIKIYPNIWQQVGAVAIEDLIREQGNPDARYEPYKNEIYLYSDKMTSAEEVIKALLHEHTHTLQDQNEYKKLYDSGFKYQNHPFELEATRAEKNYPKYLKYVNIGM